MMRWYRPESEDACQDDDDEVVLPHEWSEPADPDAPEPIDILIAREGATGPRSPRPAKPWGRTLIRPS